MVIKEVHQGQATFLVSSAILSVTAFQTCILTASDRFKTLLVMLLLRLLNPLLLFTLSYLCWLKVNAWIQCKLFCLNCKVFLPIDLPVFTTSSTALQYLLLISQLFITLSWPPTVSLQITDRSLHMIQRIFHMFWLHTIQRIYYMFWQCKLQLNSVS